MAKACFECFAYDAGGRSLDEEVYDDGGCRGVWRVGRDGNGRRLNVDVIDQRRDGILKEEN